MIKVLTRSLIPEYGVRWEGRPKYYVMCRHGDETLVFHRPTVAPKILTQYQYTFPGGRTFRQDPFFPWQKIRGGAYEVWVRYPTPSNKTRGEFYVAKDGDPRLHEPTGFWEIIIGDMT